MSASVSIVIVNWNTGSMLKECCQSIASSNFSEIDLCEVVIIDNASTDGSAIDLNFNTLPLQIISNKTNRGFGAACNQGATSATGKFILFLNPDTRLYIDTLQRTLRFMLDSSADNVGICGVRLEDSGGGFANSYSDFPTVFGICLSALGLYSNFSEKISRNAVSSNGAIEVDQVIGAYFLVRSELFRQLEGFDERFFVYFEEVDFSWRARLAGRRSVCLADVGAFHYGGGSSQQVKALRLFYSLRSRLQYACKHFSVAGFVCVLFATFFVEIFSRSVLALARGSKDQLAETWAAYRMLLCWIPPWLLKDASR